MKGSYCDYCSECEYEDVCPLSEDAENIHNGIICVKENKYKNGDENKKKGEQE